MTHLTDFTNRIVEGDCVKVLQSMPDASVDLAVTDPPYLVRYRARDGRSIANDDNADWLAPAFAELSRVLKWDRFCISFYGWGQTDRFLAAWRAAGLRPIGHFVFAKSYHSQARFCRYQHECAYLLAKGEPKPPAVSLPDVLDWRYSGDALHPTQKPLLSILPLVLAYSRPGDLVLDPFAGSGTTALAAKLLDRRYLGIELDSRYARLAQERLGKCDFGESR
jgi:site-specific DNA-methyltransferase (adenine-specific)